MRHLNRIIYRCCKSCLLFWCEGPHRWRALHRRWYLSKAPSVARDEETRILEPRNNHCVYRSRWRQGVYRREGGRAQGKLLESLTWGRFEGKKGRECHQTSHTPSNWPEQMSVGTTDFILTESATHSRSSSCFKCSNAKLIGWLPGNLRSNKVMSLSTRYVGLSWTLYRSWSSWQSLATWLFNHRSCSERGVMTAPGMVGIRGINETETRSKIKLKYVWECE